MSVQENQVRRLLNLNIFFLRFRSVFRTHKQEIHKGKQHQNPAYYDCNMLNITVATYT